MPSRDADYTSGNVLTLTISRSEIRMQEFNIVSLDTVALIECTISGQTLFREPTNLSPKVLHLNLFNTDLRDADMEFTNNVHLFFMKGQQADGRYRTFQTLLDKFRREGKQISYQVVDIQFKQYKMAQYGLAGRAWSALEERWWYYGYAKGRILRHTRLFLLIFYIINLMLREKLRRFYPVFILPRSSKWASPRAYYAKLAINTLFLTLFIFFAIKVDLNKIDTSRTRLMIYFFTQYFIGLICLFFLVNALLKI